MEKVTFDNFYGISNLELPLGKITVFTGKNCTGKSTIVSKVSRDIDRKQNPLNEKYNSEIFIKTSEILGFDCEKCTSTAIISLKQIITKLICNESSVIIFNPENFLHESSQAKLGEFICEKASEGKQIIMETHSNHFIHALLLAVKNGILKKEDVFIYHLERLEEPTSDYFEYTGETPTFIYNPYVKSHTKIYNITITDRGRVKYTPKGFFDQFNNDIREIIKP